LNNKNVTLFKEIVHNKNVNKNLMELGINSKDNIEDFSSDEVVIIRAHGEPKSTFEYLDKKGIVYFDCTCTNVKKIHELVEEFSKKGYLNIIIGKYGKKSGVMHPEVLGTAGWSETEVIFIEEDDDIEKLKKYKNKKFYLTCQTTFNENKADLFIEKIKDILIKNNNIIEVNKSICNAQKMINSSSKELAENVDLMLVVGSKHSSNTVELHKNLSKFCRAIFIDDVNKWQELLESENIILTKDIKIGITAGASTDPEELSALKLMIEKEIKEV